MLGLANELPRHPYETSKVLAPIRFAGGLVGCSSPINSKAQDVADLKAVEDRFLAVECFFNRFSRPLEAEVKGD
jgi:hypothetical protein